MCNKIHGFRTFREFQCVRLTFQKLLSLLKPEAPYAARISVANRGCNVSNATDQHTIQNLNFQHDEFVTLVPLGEENEIQGMCNSGFVPQDSTI